jgi:uncharacterized protein DUF4136
MTKPYAMVAVCLAGAAMMGAAQKLTVDSHFDATADFPRLTTYAWLPPPPLTTEVAPGAEDNPGLTQKALEPQIVASVDRELARRGLSKATDAPQLNVVFYAALKIGTDDMQLGSYYQYTTGWATPLANATQGDQVTMYEQGSIVVDLIDRSSKKAIWRGSASSRVTEENTQEKRLARVDEAVVRMFSKFPRPIVKGR